MNYNANSINQLPAGTVLFEDSQPMLHILMIIKGKVELSSGGVKLILGVGSFLGLNSVENGSYIGTCRALENVSVYPFKYTDTETIGRILASNKDYNGFALYYQNRLITEMNRNYRELLSYSGSMYEELKEQYKKYIDEGKKSGCRITILSKVSDIKEYVPVSIPDINKIQFYSEFSRVPLDTIKSFFSAGSFMTRTHIMEQAKLISQLLDSCAEILEYVEELFTLFIASTDNSLYRQEMALAIEMKSKGLDTSSLDELIASNRENLETIGKFIRTRTGSSMEIDYDTLEHFRNCYINGESFEDNSEENISGDIASQLASLTDSAKQLADYSELPEEKTSVFLSLLETFTNLPDKDVQSDDARKLRKQIAEAFYTMYKAIFFKAYHDRHVPVAVSLFLDYGYVSEKLLDEKQIVELLSLKQPEQCGECMVYTVREWLSLVFEGTKEPSRNDMGQDFQEYLRELKKQGEIDAEKEKLIMADKEYKLDYEIKNIFMSANRVINGQLTIFVPWLHSASFMGTIGKSFVDRQKVNEVYDSIVKIDYSIFHREALYVDNAAGIEREYEQKKVPPVFILFPTVGLNGFMWQEITGRKRDTESRLLLPMFTYSNLSDIMIKLFGHYRWAICKTIQGTNWNNIQYRSLTAEYSDYIQFYKKNHDLSDDRKEKLKLQIQRGRNNLREVFTIDYISWIRNEAAGAVRMNKVAREILATYCPFAYDIRSKLLKQPLYEEAFARGLRERAKKVHELELRYKGLERKNIAIPRELTYTLEYYRSF